MSVVNVEGKKSTGGRTGRRMSYRSDGEGKTTVVDLDRLNPDLDGDGKVDKFEASAFKLLKDADIDGSGKLDVHELYGALRKISSIQQAKRNLGVALCVAVVIILFQLVVMGGLVAGIGWSLMDADKQADNSTNGAGVALSNANGNVVATRDATTRLPLLVAPVLPVSLLESVSVLTVSIQDANVGTMVKTSCRVTGFRLYNATAITFSCETGDALHIWNGAETYHTSGGATQAVCEADVTCSALTVHGQEDADTYLSQARTALTNAGFEDRRRLGVLSCQDLQNAGILHRPDFHRIQHHFCNDHCHASGDGECDDGGLGSLHSACAFGTDCHDCGPRHDSNNVTLTPSAFLAMRLQMMEHRMDEKLSTIYHLFVSPSPTPTPMPTPTPTPTPNPTPTPTPTPNPTPTPTPTPYPTPTPTPYPHHTHPMSSPAPHNEPYCATVPPNMEFCWCRCSEFSHCAADGRTDGDCAPLVDTNGGALECNGCHDFHQCGAPMERELPTDNSHACGCEVNYDTTAGIVGSFCNYDNWHPGYSPGRDGTCESCAQYAKPAECWQDGLPPKGAEDCVTRCFGHHGHEAYCNDLDYNDGGYHFTTG